MRRALEEWGRPVALDVETSLKGWTGTIRSAGKADADADRVADFLAAHENRLGKSL